MKLPSSFRGLKGFRYPRKVIAYVVLADHRAHKGLNNRIEGSHRPTRKGEKTMGRFKFPRQAQRFMSDHSHINAIFRPRRYRFCASSYRHARADAFDLRNN
jgi:putative transposase